MIAFGEDDTLDLFEERAARYGGPSSEAYLRDGFLKEKPEGRTTFLMRLDQLMASEARVSRDFAKWIVLRREFADTDRLLRQAGR